MAAIRALDLFADLTDEWDFVATRTQVGAANLFFFVVEIRHASIMARGCSRVSRASVATHTCSRTQSARSELL